MKKRFIKTPLVGVQVHGAKDVGTRTVNLLMGEHAGEYVRGDIMDANAVIQAFDELKGNVDNNHDSLEEIVDELHNLRDATDQGFEVFQEKAEEETANRIQGDKTLDEKINQKERESKERDNVLQQNIDTEKQERVNADTQLRNDLTAEVNRAKASENALSEDIKAEATKRENEDGTIKDNLNAEVTRATAKENEIKAEVDIINGDSTTEGSFRKAIADVVGAAPEAYDTLKEIADKLKDNDDLHAAINDAIATKATTVALNEEITRAKAAEAENKAEIAAEAARAKKVEGDNALAIQNEVSRATNAEEAINEAVSTEVERAKGQEAYLQNLINTKADTTALEGAKTELDNKLAQKADTTTLNEQVDALNTAISAKQDAGNYIPYDPSVAHSYSIDKHLAVKIDDANTADFGPTSCIRLKGGDQNTLDVDYSGISLKSGDYSFTLGNGGISQHSAYYDLSIDKFIGINISSTDYTTYSQMDTNGFSSKSDEGRYTECNNTNYLDIRNSDEYQVTLNPDQLLIKKNGKDTRLNSSGISLPNGDDNHVLTSNAGTIDITQYALKTELPTKTSELTNDSNFITADDIDFTPYATIEALTAVEQKVTANTAAIANINKSNGIPYDTNITNYYQTDKPFYIKCDNDHTAYINPYSGIKVASSDTSYVDITPSLMRFSNGDASCELNQYLGMQYLSGTSDDSDGFKLSPYGLRIGKKSDINANNNELISISREGGNNTHGITYSFKVKDYTIETNKIRLNNFGFTNDKGDTTENWDPLYVRGESGAILVQNSADLSIGYARKIRTNPFWKLGAYGADFNGSDSKKRIEIKENADNYANIFGIKLSNNAFNQNSYINDPCEIQNDRDYVSFGKKIKVSDIITDATTDSSLNSVLSKKVDVNTYNSFTSYVSGQFNSFNGALSAFGGQIASKQDKITPTTELDLTSIDTADIESLRSIVKALATELNTLGLIKLKSAEETV